MQSMWVKALINLFLIVEGYVDYKTKHINVLLCLIFSFLGLIYEIKNAGSIENLYVGMLIILVIYLFCLLTNGQIGIGDGFVLGTLAIYIGLETIIVFVEALFICFIFSIGLISCKRIKRKETIPFVPFLYIAYILNMLSQVY